ncbi:hypothetical protein [Sphingomonas sp.]|uniref:hypothetical protein n=1 Tax=Sphingomonas sp. TaxID=28214 RepID=UPI003B3AFE97
MDEVSSMGTVARWAAQHRWKLGVAGVVALVILATLTLFPQPGPPRGLENGDFANDCCGTLALRDGKMTFNDKAIGHYTIGRDAAGPYILPRYYVGGLDGVGFEVDGARPVTKLRLDRLPHPLNLLIPAYGKTYTFKRQEDLLP